MMGIFSNIWEFYSIKVIIKSSQLIPGILGSEHCLLVNLNVIELPSLKILGYTLKGLEIEYLV